MLFFFLSLVVSTCSTALRTARRLLRRDPLAVDAAVLAAVREWRDSNSHSSRGSFVAVDSSTLCDRFVFVLFVNRPRWPLGVSQLPWPGSEAVAAASAASSCCWLQRTRPATQRAENRQRMWTALPAGSWPLRCLCCIALSALVPRAPSTDGTVSKSHPNHTK